MVENSPASEGDAEDMGSIPGLKGFPGGRNGNPTDFPMDKGAWRATVHRVANSQT